MKKSILIASIVTSVILVIIIVAAIVGYTYLLANKSEYTVKSSDSTADDSKKVEDSQIISDKLFEISNGKLGEKYTGVKQVSLDKFAQKLAEISKSNNYKVNISFLDKRNSDTCSITGTYNFKGDDYSLYIEGTSGSGEFCEDVNHEYEYRVSNLIYYEDCYKPFYQPVTCEYRHDESYDMSKNRFHPKDQSYRSDFPTYLVQLNKLNLSKDIQEVNRSLFKDAKVYQRSIAFQNYKDEYTDESTAYVIIVAESATRELLEKDDFYLTKGVSINTYYFDKDYNPLKVVELTDRNRIGVFTAFTTVGEISVPTGTFAPYAVDNFLKNAR
jgi:hypothetical protein